MLDPLPLYVYERVGVSKQLIENNVFKTSRLSCVQRIGSRACYLALKLVTAIFVCVCVCVSGCSEIFSDVCEPILMKLRSELDIGM